MLQLHDNRDADCLELLPEGRLDTTTAPELEAFLSGRLEGVKTLRFNLEKLEYISSAGLRVLLSTHKKMLKQGQMVLTRVPEEIQDILRITGFLDLLTVE